MKKPTDFSQLIGPAGQAGRILDATSRRMIAGETNCVGFLLYGPPGTGKSSLADILAMRLARDRLALSHVSGLDVNVQLVRQWLGNIGTGNLFGDYQVRLVEELDRVPRDAQDLLLHYLDTIPRKVCFIGTSNLQVDLLQERFQTRLRPFKIDGPTIEELTQYLVEQAGIAPAIAANIANFAGGNVRAALLDAENAIDSQLCLAAA